MKKSFLFLLIFVLMSSFVLSAPPSPIFQDSGTEAGAFVVYPKDDYFQQNSEFNFHVHFVNGTGTGLTSSQFECIGHFYSTQGSHLAELNSIDDSNGFDDYFVINQTVTSVKQTIPYNVYCNSTQGEGAFVSGSFKINDDSEYDETAGGFIIAILFVGVIYLLMKIAVNLNEENHAVMKLFFILSSLWVGLGGLALAKAVAVTNSGLFEGGALSIIDGVYHAYMIVCIVVTFYFAIYYLWTVLGLFSKLAGRGGKR